MVRDVAPWCLWVRLAMGPPIPEPLARVVSPPTISTTTTTGLSDPYCYLWIAPNDSKSRLKTKIMFKTLDPVWNETFELYVSTTRSNSSSTNSLIDRWMEWHSVMWMLPIRIVNCRST